VEALPFDVMIQRVYPQLSDVEVESEGKE
jgi:hypothetical protein